VQAIAYRPDGAMLFVVYAVACRPGGTMVATGGEGGAVPGRLVRSTRAHWDDVAYALSAFDVRELLCDLPVADAENVDAAYMPRTPGSINPVVAPPDHGAVADDDQFFGVEGPFVCGIEEFTE
jgi:hypothetical protein